MALLTMAILVINTLWLYLLWPARRRRPPWASSLRRTRRSTCLIVRVRVRVRVRARARARARFKVRVRVRVRVRVGTLRVRIRVRVTEG